MVVVIDTISFTIPCVLIARSFVEGILVGASMKDVYACSHSKDSNQFILSKRHYRALHKALLVASDFVTPQDYFMMAAAFLLTNFILNSTETQNVQSFKVFRQLTHG